MEAFEKAIRICGKKEDVHHHNHEGLVQSSKPANVLHADQTGTGAAFMETDQASNLAREPLFVIGCRPMLMQNVWIEGSLANSIAGVLAHIGWPEGTADPKKNMTPLALLVARDYHNGSCAEEPDVRRLVPIFRSKQELYH